jgi:predicted enzyme related to lactoylglutathione lyase
VLDQVGFTEGEREEADAVYGTTRAFGMSARTAGQGGSTRMQMKVELIPLPVSDVDRAIAFYADRLGFRKDVDVQPSEGVRVVQLTPEGSGCSVGFGTGLDVYAGEPGSVRGVHLVVEDITEARADLVRRGVAIGEIQDFGGGVKGAAFSDPDGNTFELQEMAWRKGATY